MTAQNRTRGCIILAGGSSLRFGGLDKMLLEVGNGRTLLEEVARRLEFLDEVVVSTSNEDRARRYARITGLRTVVDSHPGVLGGMLAGCRAISAQQVLVVGADMPLLRRDVIECQLSAMQGYQAVVPRHTNGFIEPLHSALDRFSALDPLERLCESGIWKVSKLFDLLRTYYMPVERIRAFDPSLDCFANVNDERTLRYVYSRLCSPQARNSRSSSSGSARALTSSLERD